MALESAEYISDLVQSNPTPTDFVNEGDDHLRLIKKAVQQSFPNVGGVVTKTHTEINNMGVPIGGIIMWGGLITALPGNWQLCNGSNGTPNLTDRFVIASSGDAGVRPTGTQGGDHDSYTIEHGHSDGSLAAANHQHNGVMTNNTHSGEGAVYAASGNNYETGQTLNASANVTGSTGITGDVEDGVERNMPLFYALAFIQRIS